MPLIANDRYFSEFERHDPRRLIVGMSGSGIIALNAARSTPISWQAHLLRATGWSFLTLTARDIHFWPADILAEALDDHGIDPAQFDTVVGLGFSMGGWGVIAQAGALGAARVLALSPRTPGTSRVYDLARLGPVAPMRWPIGCAVTVVSDPSAPMDARDAAVLRQMGRFDYRPLHGAGHEVLESLGRDKRLARLLHLWLADGLDARSFAALTGGLPA